MFRNSEGNEGFEVMTLFQAQNQLCMKLVLILNAKVPTFVGMAADAILTFINRINTTSECF